MNIVVCCKMTPDPGDIEIRSGGAISLDRAEWIIGNFDLQAIEAGMRLAEALNPPGEVGENSTNKIIALSAGPRVINSSKLKKDVLSRGPHELVLVIDDALQNADTAVTAEVLAAAVRRLGDVDLVLCGEGSADLYFQQVGLQLGEKLALPTLNAINKITPEGDHLIVERDLEEEIEVLEVPLPAVLSVTVDINQPRLPTMKEILKAGKKTVIEWTAADLDLAGALHPRIETISTRAPEQASRKKILINGTPAEAAQSLVGYLSKEGII